MTTSNDTLSSTSTNQMLAQNPPTSTATSPVGTSAVTPPATNKNVSSVPPKAKSNQTPEEIIESVGIPSPPALLTQLRQELIKEAPDIHLIEQLIKKDIGLSAKILKVANSAMYAGRSNVEEIGQAFVRLGAKIFKQVVLSSAARLAMDGDSSLHEQVWTHSEIIALTCQNVAKVVAPVNEESAYTMGLFHDCSILLLLKRDENYKTCMERALYYRADSTNEEMDAFGTNHCVGSAIVTRAWGVSDDISQAIRHHHDASIPADLSSSAKINLCMLILAESIVENALNDHDPDLPPFSVPSLERV
ncbi:MAG: HDOD domain-containing protein [Verrucomicrobiota bacterium]